MASFRVFADMWWALITCRCCTIFSHPSISSIISANQIAQDQPIIVSDRCHRRCTESLRSPANILPNLSSVSAPSYFSIPLAVAPTNRPRPRRTLGLSRHELTEGVMRVVQTIPVQRLFLNDIMVIHDACKHKIARIFHFPGHIVR